MATTATSGAQHLAEQVLDQAEACARLGSPLYAELLRSVAADVVTGGPAAEALAGHEDDTRDAAVALRLMGGVHRLVLAGQAPRLARHYPSAGGSAGLPGAWPALRELLITHRSYLRLQLQQAPQTNEVGRAAALVGGLLHIAAWRPGPLRLIEIGASAGLNLRADHFRIETSSGAVGPLRSPVVLREPWQGELPPLDAALEVVERLGCDSDPLDPLTEEGRLALTSYVWPDQIERLERLRGALDVASRVPASVERAPAGDFVAELQLRDGTTTVLWHSVMWQYLPPPEQAVITQRIASLGAAATEDSRFAHLEFEPGSPPDDQFLVRLQTWPGGLARVLGRGHPHGIPIAWG